jgi:hypothetical protein
MRAVFVDKHPVLVVLVLGIATDMIALLDDGGLGSTLIGKPLGHDKARETSADDKEMLIHTESKVECLKSRAGGGSRRTNV